MQQPKIWICSFVVTLKSRHPDSGGRKPSAPPEPPPVRVSFIDLFVSRPTCQQHSDAALVDAMAAALPSKTTTYG